MGRSGLRADVGDVVKFDQIRAVVKGIPFISEENARLLYDLVLEGEHRDCLELGFAHGVASCYIAGAIDELGSGSLTSVDLLSAADWQVPSIEELLGRLGLRSLVRIVRTHTGYGWFLRDEIRRCASASGGCEPAYDLCIIDGPKNWTIDGAAFFMADRLLRPGGRMIFDDVDWTYRRSARGGRLETDGVRHAELSADELDTPHIREVCELLVMQHPDYVEFTFTDTDWFLARKAALGEQLQRRTIEQVYVMSTAGYLRRSFARVRGVARRRA